MIAYILLLTGVYLLFISLFMSTENFRSFLVFKLTPAVLGVYLMVYSIIQLGWV